jgi:single-stranded DNA-specific DHH superfamily exonuclease
MQEKIRKINEDRRKLRDELVEKMRTNPTMKDSETLRLVENDITFWEEQTDRSVSGLLKTLNESLKL